MMRTIYVNRSALQMMAKGGFKLATKASPNAAYACTYRIQYRPLSTFHKEEAHSAKVNVSSVASSEKSTFYEKVVAAVDSATETKAHKIGRTSAEAVTDAVSGAAKVIQDAVSPRATEAKAVVEKAYVGVAETATHVKDAANQAVGQVKQAMGTKSVSENITEAVKGAATQVGEFYEGAKEAVGNATHPKK